MDGLLLVDDIMQRYKCSRVTARKIMRRMPHTEKPLTVTEAALSQWEQQRTVIPAAVCNTEHLDTGRVIVPRKRGTKNV